MSAIDRPEFADLALLRLPHNPATCTRVPCGQCKPPSRAQAPAILPNPHDAAPPRPAYIPPHLDPITLAGELEHAAKVLRASGQDTWQRLHDWTPAPRIPTYPGPDDEDEDEEGKPVRPVRSIEDERDHLEKAQASRYWSELATLVPRIDADTRRIRRLVEIANTPNRKGSVSNSQGCELCTQAGLKHNGQPVPFDHHSNVGERLPRDMFLCQPHYLYVQRHDHAPTAEQTRHWSATGTWKVKAG